MNKTQNKYELHKEPIAHKESIICGEKYRFTVLTERLIRLEYQEEGKFNDRCTKAVICRDFPVPDFKVIDMDGRLEIITEYLHLFYDKKKFSPNGLFIQLKEGFTVGDSVWNYGDKCNNLKGTARTLDNVDGAIELDDGLMSSEGFSVLDDSDSAILTEDDWMEERTTDGIDMYFFGYGHDYLACLKNFYRLSGLVPLIPKYALGNWWSRFYPYSEKTYLELMDEFSKREIPISVSVIDMDWHKTNIDKKYGSGWTGYSWNEELFPDHVRFLNELHKRGNKVTLNLHPADGVKAYEDAYQEMAKSLGIDYQDGEKIPFDVTDKKYMASYFKYLHHPLEKEGVDFWWIDWQQGSTSRTKGIDPLLMLNHLHFMDSGRNGKLPLTFSRYAGMGSHRYPIGFSGDTISSWDSLKFQPYFTANASNAGYTWWSHDIGGHQKGVRDDELITRWIQFGVFSPIMRLHSTANEFYGKEPWNYNMESEKVITEFMRLRHKLVPYIHTMNYRSHEQGIPLIQPMYYQHDEKEAYSVPNEYYFGELLVSPITEKRDPDTHMASTDIWFPEGIYYDFFTGVMYRGGKKIKVYRDINTIPVFAKAGTIVPMAGEKEDACNSNPKLLDVLFFVGSDGNFELIEDDCSNNIIHSKATTAFEMSCLETEGKLCIKMTVDDCDNVIPTDRKYKLILRGVAPTIGKNSDLYKLITFVNSSSGKQMDFDCKYDESICELAIELKQTGMSAFSLDLNFAGKLTASPNKRNLAKKVLQNASIEYDMKERIYNIIRQSDDCGRIVQQLHQNGVKYGVFGTLTEILASDC